MAVEAADVVLIRDIFIKVKTTYKAKSNEIIDVAKADQNYVFTEILC